MNATLEKLVDINDLRFRWSEQSADLLNINQLSVEKTQHVFIQGSSGSGKTTLLNLLCGINTPSSGSINVLGENLGTLSSQKRDQFRGNHLGVIFQQFNLLPFLTVKENIQLPCRFSKARSEKAGNIFDEVLRLLDALDLSESLANKKVNELSAGQQQRVAACRAMIGSPEIIIADEPTSSLDTLNRDRFLTLLFEEASRHEGTIVFVSHDPSIAGHFSQVIDLAELNKGA